MKKGCIISLQNLQKWTQKYKNMHMIAARLKDVQNIDEDDLPIY